MSGILKDVVLRACNFTSVVHFLSYILDLSSQFWLGKPRNVLEVINISLGCADRALGCIDATDLL